MNSDSVDISGSQSTLGRPPRASWWKWLSCQNPFYIVSAGCVVHGASIWYRDGGLHSPWALMGLIGTYILLLAVSAIGIVTFGQVWDDARSIFVIILLLFVELALSFDSTFVTDPTVGRWLLVAGFGLACFITEAILLGLRIRLPAIWRVAYYFMLTLLFLYPVALQPVLRGGQTQELNWRLYLFAPLVGCSIFSLLPAVRSGAQSVANNGTPWRWPMYPWTIFTVLIAGLTARAYAICASFDPVLTQSLRQAMQLQTLFAPYFLMPILVAIAALFLEAGLLSGKRKLAGIAMLLVAASVGLSAIHPMNGPGQMFRAEFVRRVGSPVFVSVWVATIFCGYAFIRKAPYGERCLNLILLVHLVVGRDTLSLATRLTEPPVWPALLLAGLHIGLGCWRHQPRRLATGILMAIGTLQLTVLSDKPQWMQYAIVAHLALAALLILGFVFRDVWLKFLAGFKLAGLAVAALRFAPELPEFSEWTPLVYILGLTAIALVLIVCRQRAYWWVVAIQCACAIRITGPWFMEWFRKQPGWRGILWYGAGIAWLLMALLVSYAKSRRAAANRKAGGGVSQFPTLQ